MATFTKKLLSGSINGRGILVAATATPGTTIHTGSTNTAVIQEVWLYASNPDVSDHVLTIEWGGTTSPNDLIKVNVAAYEGIRPIATGLVLNGAATALIIKAFADTANKVTLFGYVNEIA